MPGKSQAKKFAYDTWPGRKGNPAALATIRG
jgi:hypothetical protein